MCMCCTHHPTPPTMMWCDGMKNAWMKPINNTTTLLWWMKNRKRSAGRKRRNILKPQLFLNWKKKKCLMMIVLFDFSKKFEDWVQESARQEWSRNENWGQFQRMFYFHLLLYHIRVFNTLFYSSFSKHITSQPVRHVLVLPLPPWFQDGLHLNRNCGI